MMGFCNILVVFHFFWITHCFCCRCYFARQQLAFWPPIVHLNLQCMGFESHLALVNLHPYVVLLFCHSSMLHITDVSFVFPLFVMPKLQRWFNCLFSWCFTWVQCSIQFICRQINCCCYLFTYFCGLLEGCDAFEACTELIDWHLWQWVHPNYCIFAVLAFGKVLLVLSIFSRQSLTAFTTCPQIGMQLGNIFGYEFIVTFIFWILGFIYSCVVHCFFGTPNFFLVNAYWGLHCGCSQIVMQTCFQLTNPFPE